MNKIIIALGLIGVVLLGSITYGQYKEKEITLSGASGPGSQADQCNLATSTQMIVGKDIPTNLAATTSNRANLTVQGTNGASSTIALAFNGAVATSGANFLQNNFTSVINTQAANSTSSPIFYAGLATDNPYVGRVSAISLGATTTVLVKECIYN